MNICFLSQEYPPNIIGGVGIYTYEIAKALVEQGHSVYVITEAINKEGEFMEEGVCVQRVRSCELPFPIFLRNRLKMTIERLEYSFAVSKKLRRLVKKYKIDIVESCEARAEGFWYYLFYHKPPLIVKLHTPEGIIFKWNKDVHTLDCRCVQKLEESWIFRADRLVAISKAIANLTSKYYRFVFKGLPIIHNPMSTHTFKPNVNLNNVHNGQPTILYVGRLEFRKGVHVLTRAIPKVLKEIPYAKFIFLGSDCGMKYQLSKKIDSYGCSQNVIFIDHVERNKLVEFYQKSTICVVPSLWENFPYTCLEAMACEKPIIASDIGGIPEIIEHNKTGVLVSAGSSYELATAIVRLLKDPALRLNLGMNAKKTVESQYNPSEIASRTLFEYTRCLANDYTA